MITPKMLGFQKYLTGLRRHYNTLHQVLAGSNDQNQIEESRFAVELLDDIIHHFDLFVKMDDKPEQVANVGAEDDSDRHGWGGE